MWDFRGNQRQAGKVVLGLENDDLSQIVVIRVRKLSQEFIMLGE